MRAHLAWWGFLGLAVLLQTTLFPLLLPPQWRPDLTRALVLWVALVGVPRGGAVLAFAAGGLAGVVSGAPLGFAPAVRLAVYFAARPFRGVFFDDRPALLLPFAVLAPWADALAAAAASWLAFPRPFDAATLTAVAWRHSLLDAVLVPATFLVLELLSGRRAPRELPA